MQEGADYLLGEHDFSSFRAAGYQSKTPIKTVNFIEVERRGRFIKVELQANAFLYHMVRNIVGCLVYIGSGARNPEWMAEVLAAKKREKAAPTFFPSGLYLTGVGYPEEFKLPQYGASPF